MTTPLYPTFRKRIEDAAERIIRDQVTPWAFLTAGPPFRVKQFSGRVISYQGIGFEGSPRTVFWRRYIDPFLEALAIEEIEFAVSSAKERRVDATLLLPEVQGLLIAAAQKVFREMAEIDRRLRGRGSPDTVPLRSIEGEIKRLREFVEERIRCELAMGTEQDPKTPELIENLRWLRVHGPRNWPYVLVALIIILSFLTYKLGILDRWIRYQPAAMERNEWPDYRGCVTESPYGDPPLLVKFADGKEAYVNFRTIIQIDKEKAEHAAKLYYAPLDAYAALLESIKGAVYTELERHTEVFVRGNRPALAASIIEGTRPMQERTAFVVHEFDLLEICTPSPRSATILNPAVQGTLRDNAAQRPRP